MVVTGFMDECVGATAATVHYEVHTIVMRDSFPLFIFKADFNSTLIYQDENENWNYDDFSDTILKYHSFRKTINEIRLEVE